MRTGEGFPGEELLVISHVLLAAPSEARGARKAGHIAEDRRSQCQGGLEAKGESALRLGELAAEWFQGTAATPHICIMSRSLVGF